MAQIIISESLFVPFEALLLWTKLFALSANMILIKYILYYRIMRYVIIWIIILWTLLYEYIIIWMCYVMIHYYLQIIIWPVIIWILLFDTLLFDSLPIKDFLVLLRIYYILLYLLWEKQIIFLINWFII